MNQDLKNSVTFSTPLPTALGKRAKTPLPFSNSIRHSSGKTVFGNEKASTLQPQTLDPNVCPNKNMIDLYLQKWIKNVYISTNKY